MFRLYPVRNDCMFCSELHGGRYSLRAPFLTLMRRICHRAAVPPCRAFCRAAMNPPPLHLLIIIRGCDFLFRIRRLPFVVNYGNKTILMSTVQIIFFVFFFPFRQIRRKSLLLPVNSPAFRFGLFVKRRLFMYSECEFAWIISITGKRAG